MLYYQCNVCAPVWNAKASMYLRIDLVSLKALYMHLISPPYSHGPKLIESAIYRINKFQREYEK